MTTRIFILFIFFLSLTACGGDSDPSDNSSSGAQSNMITVTGQLSSLAPDVAGRSNQITRLNTAAKEVTDWLNAEIMVFDGFGEIIYNGMSNAMGEFQFSVPKDAQYFIDVYKGNIGLKFYLPPSLDDIQINVSPKSTAEVMLLEGLTGSNFYNEGTAVSESAQELEELRSELEASLIRSIANSIFYNIDMNYDANASEQTLGSEDQQAQQETAAFADGIKTGKQNYTVTFSISEGGSINKSSEIQVVEGGTFSFTAIPDACYSTVLIDISSDTEHEIIEDESSTNNNSNVLSGAITSDVEVEVRFQRDIYSITQTTGENGSILPIPGEVGVSVAVCGVAKTYTIEPDDGYIIKDVLVNDISIGAVSSYVFSDLTDHTKSHTIHAEFELESNEDTGSLEFETISNHNVGESQVYHLVGTVPQSVVGIETRWNTQPPVFVNFGSYGLSDILFGRKSSIETSRLRLAAKSTDTVIIADTPAEEVDVAAVLECVEEGSGPMTATVTDVNDVVLMSTEVTVTCVRPPASIACLNATSGLEKAYECNNDQTTTLPIADIFASTIIDVPIGDSIDRVLPGGVTLYLPSVISGETPKQVDFSASGWDNSLSPANSPSLGTFGLDTNHQYLFIQYATGVDLIDLSAPNTPLYTGLLDFTGREQVAEYQNFDDTSKIHDYIVMPIHTATGDYLLGCGFDVVRHDYDPAADSGNGAFVATGELISDGYEICRDVWTDTDSNGVAPGYAYTSKTISKSSKTTKWVEEGMADVTLDGDWVTKGVDVNNRIMGGAGGFFDEYALLGSRGIGELGLWSSVPGAAAEDSVIRVSSAAFYTDVRCVDALCVATSSDTITALDWPNRSIAPTVLGSGGLFSANLRATNMLAATSGSIYLPAISGTQLIMGRINSVGEFGGVVKVNISSVCTDPQDATILDMNHLGVMCRTDNKFKVLEFLPVN